MPFCRHLSDTPAAAEASLLVSRFHIAVLDAGYAGPLIRVTCLFPDPWAQQRFRRRRLLQPELVAMLARALAEGGEFVTASDNRELAEEMRAHLVRRCLIVLQRLGRPQRLGHPAA